MTKLALILAAALGAPVVTGCSTAPIDPFQAWKVAPVMAIHNAGERPEGYYALGRYHDGQGRLAAAVDAYRKALAIAPDYVPALNALGAAQARLGRLDEAIAAFGHAARLAPEASHLQNNLGYALLLAGRFEEAAGALRRAVQIDGANRRAWANLAAAYGRLGDLHGQELAEARATGRWPDGTGGTPAASPAGAAAAPAPVASPPRFTLTRTERLSLAAAPVEPADTAPTLERIGANVYELHNQAATAPAAQPPAQAAATAPRAAAPQGAVAPAAAPLPAGVRYEIANGNGRTGLARRVGELLMAGGLARPRLTNQKPFTQKTTVIQYRAGFSEAAERLAARLPFRPTVLEKPSDGLGGELRLVLGHDLFTAQACAALDLCPATVAARPAKAAAPDLAEGPAAR